MRAVLFFEGFNESCRIDGLLVVQNSLLNCVPTSVVNFGVTQSVTRFANGFPVHRWWLEIHEKVVDQSVAIILIRPGVFQHVIEAAKERAIKECRVVCGSYNQTVGGILLDELQKRIQYAAHFTHIVVSGS